MEKNKFCIVVEVYYVVLEVVLDYDFYNIKLNMGFCKVLVKFGCGKDVVMCCFFVVGMDSVLVEVL